MIKFNGQITFLNDNGTNGAVMKWFTNSLTIGSDEECDCCINSDSIGSKHCILRLSNNNRAYLTHTSSDQYKTYIEGKEVISSGILNHDCVFTLGTLSFRFQYPPISIWHSDNIKVGKSPVVLQKKFQRQPVVSTPKHPTYSVLCHETNSPTISPITVTSTKINTILPVKRLNIRPFITPIQNKMIDKNKRKSKLNLSQMKSEELRRHVSFGPNLSPEQFDKELPPIHPLKKGATPMKSLVDMGSSDDENELPDQDKKLLERKNSVVSRGDSLEKSINEKTYSSPSESDDINDSFTDKVLAKTRLYNDDSINLPKRTSVSKNKSIDLYEYSIENEKNISKNLAKSEYSISKSQNPVVCQSSELMFDKIDNCLSTNESMNLESIRLLESEQIDKMSKIVSENSDNNREISSNLSAFKKLIRFSRISNTALPLELLHPVSKISKAPLKRGKKLKKNAAKSEKNAKDSLKDRQSICMEGLTELFNSNEEIVNNNLGKSRKSEHISYINEVSSNGKVSGNSFKSPERKSQRPMRTSTKLTNETTDKNNRKSKGLNKSTNINENQIPTNRKSRLSRKSMISVNASVLREISHRDSVVTSGDDNLEEEIDNKSALRNSSVSRKSERSITDNNSISELLENTRKGNSGRKSKISRKSSKNLQKSSEMEAQVNENEVTNARKSKKIFKEMIDKIYRKSIDLNKSKNSVSGEIDDNQISTSNRKSRLSIKSRNPKKSIRNSSFEINYSDNDELHTLEINADETYCSNDSGEKATLEDSTNNFLQKINIDYEDSMAEKSGKFKNFNIIRKNKISDDSENEKNNFSQLNISKMSLRKSYSAKNSNNKVKESKKTGRYSRKSIISRKSDQSFSEADELDKTKLIEATNFQQGVSIFNRNSRKSTPMNQKSFAKNKLEKSQKSSKDELNNSKFNKSSILSRKSNVTEQNLPEIEQVNIEMATSSRKSNIDRKSIRKSGMNTSENFETHNLSDNYKLNKSEYDSSRKSRKSASFERNLSKIELENDSEITALPSRISNISHKSDFLIFRESDTNISVKSKASNKLYNEDIDIDNDCIHSESNADKTSSNNRKSRKSPNSRKSDLSEQNLLVIQENNNVKTPLSQKSLRISNRKSSSNLINSKSSDEDEIIRDELNVYFIAQSPISDLNSNDHNQYGIELQNKNNSRNSIFNEKSSSETESINNHNRRRKSYSRKESKVSLNESNQTKVHLQPETDSIELNKSEYSLNSGKFKNRKLVSSEPFLEYEENSNEISSSSVTPNLDEGILDKSKLNEFSHSQVSIDNNIATDKFSMNKEILDPVENVNISMLSNKSSIGRKSGKIKEDTFNKSEHSFISRKSNNVSAIEPEEITKSLLKSNTDSEYTPNRDKQSTRSSLKSSFSRNSAIDNRTSVAIVEESSDGEPMSSRKSIFNRKSSIDPVMKSSIEGSTGLYDSRESDNYITSRNSVTEHNYLNELNENKSILNRSKKSQKTKVKNSNISNLSSGTLNIDLDNNYNEELIIESGPHENILNFESQSRKSENTTELVRTKVDALTKAVPLKKTVKNKRTIDKDSHTSNQPPSKRQLRHAVENASESLAQDDVTSRTRSNRLREKNTFNGDTDKTANKTLTETHSIVEVIIQNPVKTRGRPKKKEVKTFIENEVVSTIDSTQINLDPTNTSPSFDSNLSKRRGRTKNINMENSDKNNIGMITQENFNEKEDLNKINTIYKKTRGRAKKIPESVVVLDDENLNKSLLNTVYQAYQLINKTRSRTKNIKVAENIEYFENNNPTVQKGTRGRAKKITNVENFQIEDSKSIDQNVTRTRSRAKIVEMKVNDSNSLSHPNANESGDLLEVVKKSRGRGPRKKSVENSKASNILELEDANSVSSLTQLTTRGQRKRVLVLEQGNSLITEVENIKNTNDVSKRTRRKNVDINNEEKLIQENSQNVDFKKPSLRIRKNKNTSDLANSEASSIIDTEQEPKVLIEKGRKNKNASQRANSEASSLIDTDQEPKRVTKKGRKNKKEIDSTISETSVIKLVQDGSITRGRRKLQIDINTISDKENEIAVMTSNSKKRIQSENVEEYNEIMVPAKVLRKNILSETNTNTENQGNEPSRTRTRRGKK